MDEELTDLNVRYAEEGESGAIPDDIPLQAIADEVVRGKRTLSRDQMRLLIELLPYYLTKLKATANFNFNFADQLEKELRAIERSKQPLPLPPPVIDHEPAQLSAEELKKPFQRYRRY
jgi:hypothetical protein